MWSGEGIRWLRTFVFKNLPVISGCRKFQPGSIFPLRFLQKKKAERDVIELISECFLSNMKKLQKHTQKTIELDENSTNLKTRKSLTFCIAISCNTSPLCKTNILCYQPYQTQAAHEQTSCSGQFMHMRNIS